MSRRVDPSAVRAGDIMAVIDFVKVASTETGRVSVIDLDVPDGDFDVIGSSLIERMPSADRFETEKKVTRTQMVEILMSSYNVPFTAVFDEKSGDERTLRGRLIAPEPLMGRSRVEDLDIPFEKKGVAGRIRQVDHRTLKRLIVNNVKYSLKK